MSLKQSADDHSKLAPLAKSHGTRETKDELWRPGIVATTTTPTPCLRGELSTGPDPKAPPIFLIGGSSTTQKSWDFLLDLTAWSPVWTVSCYRWKLQAKSSDLGWSRKHGNKGCWVKIKNIYHKTSSNRCIL